MKIVLPPLCMSGSLAYSLLSQKVCLALSKLQSMCDSVSHSGTIHPPEQADGLRGRVEWWCLAGQIPRPARPHSPAEAAGPLAGRVG